MKECLVQIYVDGVKWGRPVRHPGVSPNDAAALLHRKFLDEKTFEDGVSLSVLPLTRAQAARCEINRLG